MRRVIQRWGEIPVHFQIAMLIVALQTLAVGLKILVVSASLGGFEKPPPERIASHFLSPLLTTLSIADTQATQDRDALFRAAVAAGTGLALQRGFRPLPESDLGTFGAAYLSVLREALPSSRVAVGADQDPPWLSLTGDQVIGVEVSPGTWLTLTPDHRVPPGPIPFGSQALVALIVLLSLGGLTLWASRALIAPLRHLSVAVERFSDDLDVEPIPERGPSELRRLAAAFNDMQARISSLVQARTHTLAAIGHDLRTPLTRMRLRIETRGAFKEDERLLADINAMQVMLDSALLYLRERSRELNVEAFDLSALLQTQCDEFDSEEHSCQFQGPDRAVIHADRGLIARAVTNLLVNAANFASQTTVRLISDADEQRVCLYVIDNGPGIAAAERETLLEPFRRGDPARGASVQSGFGLGLSIVRDVVDRHGGALRLGDNSPSGLRVALELPRGSPNAPGVAGAML